MQKHMFAGLFLVSLFIETRTTGVVSRGERHPRHPQLSRSTDRLCVRNQSFVGRGFSHDINITDSGQL
jgi:hypothetical protein